MEPISWIQCHTSRGLRHLLLCEHILLLGPLRVALLIILFVLLDALHLVRLLRLPDPNQRSVEWIFAGGLHLLR